MFTDIYKTISEDDFAARSLSDYCDRATEFGQKILLSFSQILDSVDVETLQSTSTVESICSELNVSPNDYIRLNNGYVKYSDLIQLAISESISKVDTGEYTESSISVVDSSGSEIGVITYSDAIEQLKASMYATLSMGATALASVESSTADRITVFNDKINTIFQNSYANLASTAPYLRSIISDPNCSAGSTINKIIALLGVTTNAQDQIDEESLDESDILKYTGASPISVLSCYSQLGVVGSAISKGVQVIGRILLGLTKLVVKGVKWLVDNTYGIAVNPNDLAVANKNSKAYTIDQWRYNAATTIIIDSSDDAYHILQADPNFYSKYYGSWIKTDSIFSEKLVKIVSIDTLPSGDFRVNYEFQAKPKYVNWYSIYNAFLPYGEVVSVGNAGLRQLQVNLSQLTMTGSKFAEMLYGLKFDPSLRDDTDCEEIQMFMGFYLSTQMELLSDLVASHDGDYLLPSIRMYEPKTWIAANPKNTKYAVTNLSFVKVASGWFDYLNEFAGQTPSISNCIGIDNVTFVGGDPIDFTLAGLTFSGTAVKATMSYLSSDDEDFLPYRNNVETFNAPHYIVKTDEQNIAAWERILTVATIVVLVAAVATIATIGIKIISNRLYAARSLFINSMNAKMRNGEKMSIIETFKYRRYSNKVAGQSFISNGLQSGYDQFVNDPASDPNFVNFDNIINLIH